MKKPGISISVLSGIIAQLLFPLLALVHGLSASNSWPKILLVMRGANSLEVPYDKCYLQGSLIIISLLVLGYLICYFAAFVLISKKMTVTQILLLIFGSVLLLISTFISSFVYVAVNDIKFCPDFLPPNSLGLIALLHLVALLVSIYFLIRNSSHEAGINPQPEPPASTD